MPDGRGIVWNHHTGEYAVFGIAKDGSPNLMTDQAIANLARKREERTQAAKALALRIVRASSPERHPYLQTKGFAVEKRLVLPDRLTMPHDNLGFLADMEPPFLIVPALVHGQLSSIQAIDAVGRKKNLPGGRMSGAYAVVHRTDNPHFIAICEGVATALSIRTALMAMGNRCTVFAAFSAANVSVVAESLPGTVLVFADNDRIQPRLGHMGAGAFWARASGKPWIQPDEIGDWNDYHIKHGLTKTVNAISSFVTAHCGT